MKNKGFTLIELVAVIVIMGMLLLIVFPATSRLMKQNEDKKYDTYYDIVDAALEQYARSKRSDLGGTSGSGCFEDESLNVRYLIDNEYITEFNEEEGVVCGSPSEFNLAELSQGGIENPSQYVDIRVKNDKGKITTEFSLICKKENSGKIMYSKLVKKEGTCESFIFVSENSLLEKIKDSSKPSYIPATLDSNSENYFVNNTATNNYIWYSGEMWKIISYNLNDRTIKMVMDENVSLITYNYQDNSDYIFSNAYNWLNDNFSKTLKNPAKYLINNDWNYTSVSDNSLPNNTSIVNSKIGLLNYYEYDKVKDQLTGGNYWLLSKNGNDKVWYVNNDCAVNVATPCMATFGNVTQYKGIRPAVVLVPNIKTASGDGTISNPYRFEGDTSAKSGALLKDRLVGEYVIIDSTMFRIMEIKNNYIKLIASNTISLNSACGLSSDDITFDSNPSYEYSVYSSDTDIANCLNMWIQNKPFDGTKKLSEISPTIDFCIDSASVNTRYMANTCYNTKNFNVAIPRINDMFASGIGKSYWTMTNVDDETTKKVYSISVDGTVDATKQVGQDATDKSGIRPVIVLPNTVFITSGSGTSIDPYFVGLN